MRWSKRELTNPWARIGTVEHLGLFVLDPIGVDRDITRFKVELRQTFLATGLMSAGGIADILCGERLVGIFLRSWC